MLGGEAVANDADFEQAEAMVQQAIDTFGGLDILVNHAGFVRDRMLVNAAEDRWDAVIRVHLKGHSAPLVSRSSRLEPSGSQRSPAPRVTTSRDCVWSRARRPSRP